MKKKTLMAIIATLMVGTTLLFGCGESNIKEAPSEEIPIEEKEEEVEEKEEIPITIDQIEFVESYFETDSIGTTYFNTKMKNNSKYPIKSIDYCYEIDGGEQSCLVNYDGIPVGGVSSLEKCFGVSSQNFDDMKLIGVDITYLDENNQTHALNYNANLGIYEIYY